MSASDSSKLLETVRGLLNKANNTPYEAEAEAFRAKADELMVKYAISQYDLDAAGDAKTSKFGAYEFSLDFYWDATSREFASSLYSLLLTVARHTRLVRGPFANGSGDLILIGLKSDFEYCEMLFTSLMLEMTRMMVPQWNSSLTREENVVVMKHAGYMWKQIADQLAKHDEFPHKYQKNGQLHGCYIAMYKKGLKERGGDEQQLKTNPSVHLRSFTLGFTRRVDERLRAQKQAAANEPGQGLVLLDMSKELMEYAQQEFPEHFAPKKASKSLGRSVRVDYGSMAQGRAAGDRVDLGGSKLGHRGELR